MNYVSAAWCWRPPTQTSQGSVTAQPPARHTLAPVVHSSALPQTRLRLHAWPPGATLGSLP